MMRESFTNGQMTRYFDDNLSYSTPMKVGGVGIVAIILGISLMNVHTSTNTSITQTSTNTGIPNIEFIVLLIGIAMLPIAYWIARNIYYSVPSDAEYDAWVNRQIENITTRAANRLSLDTSQLVRNPLILRSVVLEGSKASNKYELGEVRMKKGKDQVWRYSLHDCSLFFPANHYISVFTTQVSACNQGRHDFDETHEYSYQGIVGITTSNAIEQVLVAGESRNYQIQQCSLKISNGGSIDLGAAIKARAMDTNTRNLLTISEVGVEEVIRSLQLLLREKRQTLR